MKNYKNRLIKRENNFKTLSEFVKFRIQECGGDYDVIRKQLETVFSFVQYAKEINIKADFTKIEEAWKDFFLDGCNIKKFSIAENEGFAMYKKAGDDKKSFKSDSCVMIMKHKEYEDPVIYLDEEKNGLNFTKKIPAYF